MQQDAALVARVADQLERDGYAMMEGVMPTDMLETYRQRIDALMAEERERLHTPEDGTTSAEDEAIADYYRRHYTVSEAEVGRILARVRHDRRRDLDTGWPVPYPKVAKSFIHLPTMFDQDRSQRVWHIPNKAPELIGAAEHPQVLAVARRLMGEDCTLHDYQATSIGPGTGGGSWHVDAPLGQIPEPLPEFALTLQTVWLLDDFTEHNGATRIVPGSHRSRRSPPWSSEPLPDEVALTAPAGSVALWLSNTWHRSGPNSTDRPRRALIINYNRSWVRGFTDFTATLDPEMAKRFSPTARYLLGYGARAPERR